MGAAPTDVCITPRRRIRTRCYDPDMRRNLGGRSLTSALLCLWLSSCSRDAVPPRTTGPASTAGGQERDVASAELVGIWSFSSSQSGSDSPTRAASIEIEELETGVIVSFWLQACAVPGGGYLSVSDGKATLQGEILTAAVECGSLPVPELFVLQDCMRQSCPYSVTEDTLRFELGATTLSLTREP